jgi:propionyl-CoA synthetase
MVRERIGPVAAFKRPRWSSACPRPARARSCAAPFRSATIADGKDYRMPATIDDPAILGEMEDAGYRSYEPARVPHHFHAFCRRSGLPAVP